MAARTWSIKWAPRGDRVRHSRIRCDSFSAKAERRDRGNKGFPLVPVVRANTDTCGPIEWYGKLVT